MWVVVPSATILTMTARPVLFVKLTNDVDTDFDSDDEKYYSYTGDDDRGSVSLPTSDGGATERDVRWVISGNGAPGRRTFARVAQTLKRSSRWIR